MIALARKAVHDAVARLHRLHLLRRRLVLSYKKGKKGIPTATHVVEYKAKETRTKALVGKVAIEFSTENYGPEEWWLLLEPTPAAGSS